MSTERRSGGALSVVLIVVLAVLVLFPLVVMAFALPMMGMTGMMGSWGGMGGRLSPLWGIGMLLVWLVLLVAAGYLLYRGLMSGFGSTTGDPALEELRLAYARGDLSEEEFDERREKLSRGE